MTSAFKALLFLVAFPLSVFAHPSEVLVIGDSQSFGRFGERVRGQLQNAGVSVSYYARSGSGGQWWLDGESAPQDWGSWDAPAGEKEHRVAQSLPTPLLTDLLYKHHPKLTVVQLGGNMTWESERRVREEIEGLVARIRQARSRCLWVGPPAGDRRREPEFSEFYVMLTENANRLHCEFLDSRKLINPLPHGGDGIHLDTMSGGERASLQWSQAISKRVLELLGKPAAAASPRSR